MKSNESRHVYLKEHAPETYKSTVIITSYLVKGSSDIYGAVLYNFIHHVWDGLHKIWVGKLQREKTFHCTASKGHGCSCWIIQKVCSFYLRVKKYLWSQKAFISDIYLKFIFADGIDSLVFFDPFARIHVIFGEFLHYVWTDVAIPFLKLKRANMNKLLYPVLLMPFGLYTIIKIKKTWCKYCIRHHPRFHPI